MTERTLKDLQPLMHPQMYAELLSIAAEARDSETYEIERHHLRGDYDRTGRYFGALASGERMYAVHTDRGVHYVRTQANLRQLKSAFAEYRARTQWHVVTQGGVVLGVFGAAILSAAQECAQRIQRDTGLIARVEQIHGKRPSVGQQIGGR